MGTEGGKVTMLQAVGGASPSPTEMINKFEEKVKVKNSRLAPNDERSSIEVFAKLFEKV